MFPTDFGEPAAFQLGRVIRTHGFWRADCPGVRQVLLKRFGGSDLCFIKYSRDILDASSRKVIPYWFPPMDRSGFFPEVSTYTRPCYVSARDSVVFFTGALNPFAAEHPTHRSSFTPGFSLTPCCFAEFLSRRGWVWAVVRWYWLRSKSVVGNSPEGGYGTGFLYVITIDSGAGTHVPAIYYGGQELPSRLYAYEHSVRYTSVVVAGYLNPRYRHEVVGQSRYVCYVEQFHMHRPGVRLEIDNEITSTFGPSIGAAHLLFAIPILFLLQGRKLIILSQQRGSCYSSP